MDDDVDAQCTAPSPRGHRVVARALSSSLTRKRNVAAALAALSAHERGALEPEYRLCARRAICVPSSVAFWSADQPIPAATARAACACGVQCRPLTADRDAMSPLWRYALECVECLLAPPRAGPEPGAGAAAVGTWRVVAVCARRFGPHQRSSGDIDLAAYFDAMRGRHDAAHTHLVWHVGYACRDALRDNCASPSLVPRSVRARHDIVLRYDEIIDDLTLIVPYTLRMRGDVLAPMAALPANAPARLRYAVSSPPRTAAATRDDKDNSTTDDDDDDDNAQYHWLFCLRWVPHGGVATYVDVRSATA